MRIAVDMQESLAGKFGVLFPHLDERQRRLVAGAEARPLGHGGIRVVARAAGMREGTVSRGGPGTSKWNAIEHRLFSHISMNWGGRPLTSHEVIINTIAATTTRTGLRVRAELDTSHYPTGEAISDADMAALAITRHHWHGEWNYTLHPAPPQPAGDTAGTPAARPQSPDRGWLKVPALTGLTAARWDALTAQIAVARHAQREAGLHQRRGGRRQAAAGTGRKAVLTLNDRIVITLLAQRFSLPGPALAGLFTVSTTTINNVIRQTRPLLAITGHHAEPAGTQLSSLTELVRFAADAGIPVPDEIKSAC